MLSNVKWFLLITATSLVALQSSGDNIRLPDQPGNQGYAGPEEGRQRQGKDLFDWIGLGTGPNQDPYLAKTNAACLGGDLAECFKSQALGTFNDFFSKESYSLTGNARVVRMPDEQLRSLAQEPFEFSTEPRAADTEWDQLVKFALRKVERFVKSAAFEIQLSDDVTADGRYSPRFIDEIADELDVIEDKKDSLFSRNRLKKLFIPMLVILKIFKLKLLLFLPLILGLASFKKLLGFLAIIIPGVIGYFKLCKPNLQQNYGGFGQTSYFTNGPQYSPAGLGVSNYGHGGGYGNNYYREDPNFVSSEHQYGNGYGRGGSGNSGAAGSVAFRDESNNAQAQDIAYQGYSEYRSKKTEAMA